MGNKKKICPPKFTKALFSVEFRPIKEMTIYKYPKWHRNVLQISTQCVK